MGAEQEGLEIEEKKRLVYTIIALGFTRWLGH